MNPNSFQKPAAFNSQLMNGSFTGQQTQQMANLNMNAMLNTLGMSREQFSNLSRQEQQMAGAKYMAVAQANSQQHQLQQMVVMNMSQQPFDRPSSSHQMMPPPPPRPPTAAGGAVPPQQSQHISRPGTSLALRSPTIPGAMHDMMAQRPSSRVSQRSDSANGFKPSPQASQQMFNPASQSSQQALTLNQQNPFPSTSNPPNSSASPTMGSPYRGAKRKLTGEMITPNMGMNNIGMSASGSQMSAMPNVSGNNMGNMNMSGGGIPSSPRMGGALGLSGLGMGNSGLGNGGIMGPPGLPRSVSNDSLGMGMNMNMSGMVGSLNGVGIGSMGGGMGVNNNTTNNLNMGASNGAMMNGQRQSPRPPSAMAMENPISGGLNGMGMGGMNMGMNVDLASRAGMVGGAGPSGSQSNNASIGPQTPMRQGSLPPQNASTPQPNHGGGSMMRQGSLPPSGAMSHQGIGMGGGRAGMVPPANGMMGGNMNMGMGIPPPSSPLQGVGVGPQAMAMTPSISASSIGGTPAINGISNNAIGSTNGSGGGIGGAGPIHASISSSSLSGSANTGAAAASSSSSLGPMPTNLNLKTTEISVVPLLTSMETIPPLSAEEIAQVKGWMEKDRAYESLLGGMQRRMGEEAREVFSVDGIAGPQWWERGAHGNGMGNWNRWRKPREPFELRYPRQRPHVSRSGRKTMKREGLRLPRRISPEKANRPEQLVPIRVEFDVEHHRMRDTFVWNLNDPVVTPEIFAQSLVEDYNLAPSYHAVIVKSIQDQLTDFRAHSNMFEDGAEFDLEDENAEGAVIKGVIEKDDAAWWEAWRRQVQKARIMAEASDEEGEDGAPNKKRNRKMKSKSTPIKKEAEDDADMLADNEEEEEEENDKPMARVGDLDDTDDAFKPLSLDEIAIDEKAMHEDMRILIKLDIIVASIKLEDQFEWDLDNPTASPEDFAEVYTQELGLGGEFKTAIAHSIREQVQTYQKSLFLVGHPSDGTPIQDEELKQAFLPSLTSAARPVSEVVMFTPVLNYLSDGELERTEKERDKDLNKRRKRNTRGRRGIALPDREPIRTYRTPAIGFPELDAATLALAAAANAPMSRRAAAAAASLTIANMVASENGTAFMPQTLPTVPQPAPVVATSKEKKPKGLFKAPSFPSSVLRPRAHVSAPTPSTAADTSSMGPMLADAEALAASSSTAMMGLDSRSHNSKLITAKKQKELEREAKEKEFVDGQHPNFINGVWHCSNCGCPESIAIGRRKGPLGDKSQCGTCGKFWHRHRRPRPVEYNADPDYHTGLKQKELEAAASKTPASRNKKGGAAAALRAQSAANSAATPDISEPQTPTRSAMDLDNADLESSRRSLSPPLGGADDDRAMSPVSTASSASEPPLAQRVKSMSMNTGHSKQDHSKHDHVKHTPMAKEKEAKPSTPAPAHSAPKSATPANAQSASGTESVPTTSATPASPSRAWPPQWLSAAMQAMQARYPHDRFEVLLRKGPVNNTSVTSTQEWRIKCLDCPGKLYTPGPGETLSNYDVHLKNRLHRQRVNDRLAAANGEVVREREPSASASVSSVGAANPNKPSTKDSSEKKEKSSSENSNIP